MFNSWETDFGCWYIVNPLNILPDLAVVCYPVACVIMCPIYVTIGSSIAIVWAVDISSRNVVVFVFSAIR